MRDPKRVDEVLNLVSRIWRANPDFRFYQLIYILQTEYSEKNGGVGKVVSPEIDGFAKTGYDFFNLEDDEFQKYLQTGLDNGAWGEDA